MHYSQSMFTLRSVAGAKFRKYITPIALLETQACREGHPSLPMSLHHEHGYRPYVRSWSIACDKARCSSRLKCQKREMLPEVWLVGFDCQSATGTLKSTFSRHTFITNSLSINVYSLKYVLSMQTNDVHKATRHQFRYLPSKNMSLILYWDHDELGAGPRDMLPIFTQWVLQSTEMARGHHRQESKVPFVHHKYHEQKSLQLSI